MSQDFIWDVQTKHVIARSTCFDAVRLLVTAAIVSIETGVNFAAADAVALVTVLADAFVHCAVSLASAVRPASPPESRRSAMFVE